MTARKAKVLKYEIDRYTVCTDCNVEWDGKDCEKQARDHTRKTGCITSLRVHYDLAKEDIHHA